MEIPTEARAALASSLFESLDDRVDASAEEEWKQEIARRIAELDLGKMKPVPWVEARRQICAILHGNQVIGYSPRRTRRVEVGCGVVPKRSETAAIKFINAIDEGMGLALALPQRRPAGKYNTRKFVLRRYPFAIVYRETETGVKALAIAHGRRRPGYRKGRR